MSSMAFIGDICKKQFPPKRNPARHKKVIHCVMGDFYKRAVW